MGYSKGPVGTCSPNRAAALEILNQAPCGKYASETAELLGMEPKQASKMMQNMRDAGVIGSLPEGGGNGCARRVRYFALQHEAEAKVAHEAGRGVTWGCGRKGAGPKLQPRQHVAASHGKTPEPVICPAFTGNRFVPDKPEQFFSRPGYSPSFIGHDTWAAKAYA